MHITTAASPGIYKSDAAIAAGYVPTDDERRETALNELREAIRLAVPALERVEAAYRDYDDLIDTAAVDDAAEYGLAEFRQALKELG